MCFGLFEDSDGMGWLVGGKYGSYFDCFIYLQLFFLP